MFCSRCGTRNQPEGRYCISCGMPLEQAPPQDPGSFPDTQFCADERFGAGPAQHPWTRRASAAPLVLGVLGAIFAILFPGVTYPCSIVGLVLANRDIRDGLTPKTTYRTLNIVALVLAAVNSLAGIFMTFS